MNFLLTWIHWGLAALLYFHNAKLSQAAPTQRDGERHHSEVIPFLEVFNRSACRAIETMVDILQEYPDQVEYIFKPSCVPLMKCGGCCNDEAMECVPTEVGNITMQIMRIKHFQSQHMSQMSFQEHRKCECRPKKAKQEEKSKRGKGKGQKRKRKRGRYKPQTFHCEPCSERRKHLFVQDPQTCKCSCKYTDARCKLRQLELNERTCRCYAPRR